MTTQPMPPQACAWGYRLLPATRAMTAQFHATPGLRHGATIFCSLRGLRLYNFTPPQACAWGYRLLPATRAMTAQFHATPGLHLGLPSSARYAGYDCRISRHPRLAPGATVFCPLRGLSAKGIMNRCAPSVLHVPRQTCVERAAVQARQVFRQARGEQGEVAHRDQMFGDRPDRFL